MLITGRRIPNRPPLVSPLVWLLAHLTFDEDTGCWEPHYGTSGTGYATMGLGNHKTVNVHRYLYQQVVGPVPSGLVLDHLCRNKRCCNPDHLEPVTTRMNVVERGVGPNAEAARRTTCLAGHEFSIFTRGNGKQTRYCKICRSSRRPSRAKGEAPC